MPELDIDSLQLDRYTRLLQSLLPADISLAMYEPGGTRLWGDGRFPHADDKALSQWIASQYSGEQPLSTRCFDDSGLVYIAPITNQHQQPVAVLTLDLSQSDEWSYQPEIDIEAAIGSVAECVTHVYQLAGEAGMMADELSERYEELNLVYEAEDNVRDSTHGLEAMQELVNSCVDFLNIGMAVLVMPEKKISIFSVNQSRPFENRQRILLDIRGPLFDWLERNRRPLVINQATDPLRDTLCPNIPYKLIAVPVEASGQQLEGILVIINQAARPDFTNSDRNLLNVIARKMAKLILASFDSLTGLDNLNSFEIRAQSALVSAQTRGISHAILNIDIDHTGIINDICGRDAGDALIQSTGRLIKGQVRSQDMVARIGGDEFGVLLENCPLKVAVGIAGNIQRQIGGMLFEWDGSEHEISACIGLAPVSPSADSCANILSAVEVARNAAKERGRNKLRVFEMEDIELLRRKGEMQWVGRIQRALREDRFQLYGQPIVSLQGDSPDAHYEILIRMQDEAGELLSPGAFMPAAEHFYLMPAIDRWVVDKAFSLLAEAWPMFDDRCITVSINLSGQSIGDEGFQGFLIDHLRNSPLPGEMICFEITETAAISNLTEAQELIRLVKALGCSVSLDDFGSGLSSYTYLKNLAVDYLKIDGSFVRDITTDDVSRSMVSAINQVGHAMGLRTVAEWVENEQVADILRGIGVDFGQGYGLGRPLPVKEQLDAVCMVHNASAGHWG